MVPFLPIFVWLATIILVGARDQVAPPASIPADPSLGAKPAIDRPLAVRASVSTHIPMVAHDWVEDPPAPEPTGPGKIYFSGNMVVNVLGKGEVKLKDLQAGERVQAPGGGYQQVFLFGHRHPKRKASFLKLDLAKDGQKLPSLEVSEESLLYLQQLDGPVRADSLCAGNILRMELVDEGVKLTKIQEVFHEGLYAPLTTSGLLLIQGIWVSCYASFDEEAAEFVLLNKKGKMLPMPENLGIYLTFTPIRLFCSASFTSRICNPDGSYSEDGLHYLVDPLHRMALWGQETNFILQLLLVILFLMIFGPIFILEQALLVSFFQKAFFVGVLVVATTHLALSGKRNKE